MFCNHITNHGAALGERHLIIMLMDTQLRYDDHARTQVITFKYLSNGYLYCMAQVEMELSCIFNLICITACPYQTKPQR